MTRSGATAAVLAGRFFRLSLAGLVTSGYLALIGSGRLDSLASLLAVHLVFLAAIAGTLAAKSGRHYAYVSVVAFLELLWAAVLSTNVSFLLFLAAISAFSRGHARQRGSPPLHARAHAGGARRPQGISHPAGWPEPVCRGRHPHAHGRFVLCPAAHGARRLQPPGAGTLPSPGLLRRGPARRDRQDPGAKHAGPALACHWLGQAAGAASGAARRSARSTANGGSLPPPRAETVRVDEGRAILVGDEQRRRAGPRITYEVQLEAAASDVLFFAGLPEVLWIDSPSVARSTAGVYRLEDAPRERLRYGAISYLNEAPATAAGGAYLQLPAVDSRIAALARQVTSQAVFGRGAGASAPKPSQPELRIHDGTALRVSRRSAG